MDKKDFVGKRGESLFTVMITNWCGHDGPWFDYTFLGDKHPVTDFLVDLVNPTSAAASFYVQIKATRGRYTGSGSVRKLRVGVTKADMAKLKRSPAPAFVVGIDIESDTGYVVQITKETPASLPSIPLTDPLDCARLQAIWKWVDGYWSGRDMLPADSAFA